MYIYEKCPHDQLTIIMKRYFYRIAQKIANSSGAMAIATGESIGQVSSQTLQSLAVINEVAQMPVIRPLVSFDKQEIIDISEKIGTYETSIQPYEDCCTTFVAKHPVTKPNSKSIHKSEEHLAEKIDELVRTALETVEVITIG
jgi:thiamine biosynthesis protein ThiI